MEYLNHYILYITTNKKLSKNTIKSYETDLKQYLNYLEINNIKVEEVVENDIISYSLKLEQNNKSISTISRVISSIKSFHEYLFFERKISKNPSKNIRKPLVSRSKKQVLSEDEINSLLNFKRLDTPKLIRDKAIFEVLYGTGMKVTELIELKIEDVNLEIDFIKCGNKERIIPLSKTTKVYLKNYIENSRDKLVNENENSIFVNSNGNKFSRQGLWKIIKTYAKEINIDKNINPSMLRDSFAVHLLDKGANVYIVSKILGNDNLSTVQSYIDQLNQNIRKEINEKHPRN